MTTTDTAPEPEAKPTKALVTELRAQLAHAQNVREMHAMDLRTSEDRRKVLEADAEARCLAECADAISRMRATMDAANRNAYGTVMRSWDDDVSVSPRPPALGDPTGRVLLTLAARFGQEVGAIPAPVREPMVGQQLVSVPAHVAEQLNRMPMEAFGR